MSILNSKTKAVRTANLATGHMTVLNALTSAGQSLAQIAASCGITQDDAEKKLSGLVDEALATRTAGSRTTARYALA